MDFDKLLKNDYVRLALLAVVAYLVYRYFFVVRESIMPANICFAKCQHYVTEAEQRNCLNQCRKSS